MDRKETGRLHGRREKGMVKTTLEQQERFPVAGRYESRERNSAQMIVN